MLVEVALAKNLKENIDLPELFLFSKVFQDVNTETLSAVYVPPVAEPLLKVSSDKPPMLQHVSPHLQQRLQKAGAAVIQDFT